MVAKKKVILGLGLILLSHSYLENGVMAAPLNSESSPSAEALSPIALISSDKRSELNQAAVDTTLSQSTDVSNDLVMTQETEDLWQYMRAKFAFKAKKHRRITQITDRLRHNDYHFRVLAERAQPFLHIIVTALEKRNLPMELSLLPMIESGFQPTAVSHRHAAGLWQIIPPTGRHLGLKSNRWYDGRYDIHASTEAALDYLEYLHQSFHGDWFLALAAYNAGEGRVRRAIRINKRLGKPIDYWNLRLPSTTRLYVPKLLALANVIKNPDQYQVHLPKIPNSPHLVSVEVSPRMRLAELATLAEVTLRKIKHFNTALRRDLTPPDSPYNLWLPPKNADVLVQRLDNYTKLRNDYHVVRRGDTLYGIARDYQLSYHDLARWNNIDVNDLLMPGQKLLIEPLQS
jgi:membrane-bound lytic murein transglycosylase D